MKSDMLQLGINIEIQPKPTFYFFNFPLPWDECCLKVFKVTIELEQFLKNIKQNIFYNAFRHYMFSVVSYGTDHNDLLRKVAYLGHHDFEGIELPTFSFAQSTFKLLYKSLCLPKTIYTDRQTGCSSYGVVTTKASCIKM